MDHLGIRSGEELGLATVLPLHFVVLASRPSHHLDYLATAPSGADLGRLDDNPISAFCIHASTSTLQPTPVYEGCIGPVGGRPLVSLSTDPGSAVGAFERYPVRSQHDEQPELHEQRLISGGDLCARFDWSGDGP